MKVKELDNLIESIISNEIRKSILSESMGEKYEVYHIKCDGEPVETYQNEEEAEEHLDMLKKEHPGKQFIVEKESYESHEDMIHKLDEMGEQLEEGDIDEEKLKPGFKSEVKDKLEKELGREPSRMELIKAITKEMEKQLKDDEEFLNKHSKQQNEEMLNNTECKECGMGYINEEGTCNECGSPYQQMEENHDEIIDLNDLAGDSDFEGDEQTDDQMDETDGECMECGDGYMEENDSESVCPECGKEICECGSGIYESKKRTIRLTETELKELISKMVAESIPGLEAAKKAHKESGVQNKKELDDMMKDVEKNYLSFDDNDKPEFPHQLNSKTKKEAYTNNDEQDEETAKNFAGLQNLEYDLEPSEAFKKRLKMAIEGDPLMGNGPITEKPSIKPSNGADKGKEAKEKQGNHIPTPQTAKKMETQMKDRDKDKKERVLYPKEKVPVNESKVNFSNILLEEMNKMKKLSSYNKKPQ